MKRFKVAAFTGTGALIEDRAQPLTSRQIELRDLGRAYPPEYTHN